MGITLRNVTGSALSYDQMDENFRFLSQSYFYLSGSNTISGSITLSGSLNMSGSSVYFNTSTFTVADNPLADPIFTVSATAVGVFGTSSFNGITNITGSTNISGSATITGSLRVSGSITSSLLGTASIASSVTPLSQSVVITGSLIVSNSIDSSGGILYYSNNSESINWNNGKLYSVNGNTSIDYENRILRDTASEEVLNWSDKNTAQFYGTSSFAITASSVTPLNQTVIITGSLTVSGSSTFTNIGPAVFTGSISSTGSNTFTGTTAVNGTFNVSGAATFSDTIFTVTGSQFYSGSSTYIGNQTITGSLSLTSNDAGTGLFINGQKQFNFLSAYHTASITPTQNVSGSFIYSTIITSSGITITNNSRITFANTGIYNIQFSAQVFTQTGATVYVWLKRNGTNVADTAGRVGPTSNNTYAIEAWNYVDTFTSGSYVEIAYQSDQSNTEFQYIAAAGNIPATPSIIVTVTQVA